MRKFIGVIIPLDILTESTEFRDIQIGQVIRFRECAMVSAEYDLMYGAINIYIHHSELPEVPQCCMCERYYYPEARRKFPFLFADNDTNALLYRKFSLT